MEKKAQKRFHWMLSLLAVAGLIGLGISLYLFPPDFFKIQEVVIMSPPGHLSHQDLIRLSEVKKGDPILRTRLTKIRANLLRFPWVQEVQIARRIPGRLLIWVTEQQPVAILEHAQEGEDATGYFVNEEGKVFKKIDSKDLKDLPVITGMGEDSLKKSLKPIVSLIHSFEKLPAISIMGVSEIQWKSQGQDSKRVTLFTKEPCIQLELGEDDWEEKLGRFASSWETIRTTSKEVQLVDLSFDRRVIVRQKM